MVGWVRAKVPDGVNPGFTLGLVMKLGREILLSFSVPLMSDLTVMAPRISSPMKNGLTKNSLIDCFVKAGLMECEKIFDMTLRFKNYDLRLNGLFEFVLEMGRHFFEELFAEGFFSGTDFDLRIGTFDGSGTGFELVLECADLILQGRKLLFREKL